MRLHSWKEFQNRQGAYGGLDKAKEGNEIVKVFIDGTPIDNIKIYSHAQASAVKFLFEHQYSIRDILLRALLADFPNMKEVYEEQMPTITDIEQYKDLVGLSIVHVLNSEKDDFAYIGFELGCTWDEEHGVGVMMHKDRVISVGQADESFEIWTTYKDNGTYEQERMRWDEENGLKNSPAKSWWKFWDN